MRYPNITKNSGLVPSNEGLPIYYDFYVPSGNSEKQFPVIIFLHGFKGFKDWGAFPDACAELSAAGFAVLAMNFSLNGVGENMLEFDQLDLFARETLSQDLDDVGTVITALKDGTISTDKASLDTDEMGILGHSRGGHTAVAAAAEYPEIACLVTWSAVADYNARWSDEMIADWNAKGVTEIENGRTGQIMPVKDVVYKDALANADRLMAIKRVGELNVPSLFIHSKGDEGVPYSEAEKLYRNCPSEEKELKLIPGSGHTFDTSHPFEEDEFPEAFQHVLDATIEWFEYYLQ
ncbi:MAG: alpha/beta hydrolase [Balneolaceae bacterium]|jgi:dienelactone hydrolase